jgi:AcrR family transcriptional regulator
VTDTRQRLIDAATRVFAEQGVETASLLEVARRAGQRNRGAVHYHFGSRAGVLVAVLEQYAGFLAEREGELLRAAEQAPDTSLTQVVEAVVRPAVELAETGWRGRCYLVVVAELAESDQEAMDPEVAAALARTGGYAVYELLTRRMPPMDGTLRTERLSLLTGFVLRSVADRARAVERGQGRAQLDTDAFTANLVAMASGMLAAPSP